MKKIILITAGMIAVLAGYSQTNKGNNAGNTGVVEPTINGKPYSQYKAEQDALKKQQDANKQSAATQNAGLVTINASDARPAPAKVQPAETKSDNDGYSKPAPVVTEQAVVEVKTEPVVLRQQPEGAQIPARLALSKNSTTSNSKGTPPVEKVTPVNRTTEEAVGNNGTTAAVAASKTKVEPAKTAEVAKSAIPADIKLVSGANAEKTVKEEVKAEPVATGDKKMSDSRKQD